ncbi:Metallo-dependent phosphatase [Anaeromyces robustus]|uniref:Metallo-dependent phosphatase n=1 Tax=Anaeromyces robustus TaxID=1754192 RepID=A0A1Y1XBQ6_9FUNG|nr:Metallo-dependent phosphatase [Anaeromyces robustus]|eukprot:ORX83167.1 Metallo-dependent phosphatase [Anaeromyces robustus]
MKFQNILLLTSLALGSVISENIDYAYTTDDLKYNFKCLEDNKGVCKYLEKELYEAINGLSEIHNLETPLKFEAFVDDLSKYRLYPSREVVAVVLNKEFVPLSTKDKNIISPYPNSEAILANISKENENDFYLVLNNFKSNESYLDSLREDFDSSIVMEITEELKSLGLIGYPYGQSLFIPKGEFKKEFFFPKRREPERMDATAKNVTEFCNDMVNLEKSHTLINWEDTLISKESITTKVRRAVKKLVKCYVPKKYMKNEDDELKNNEGENELNRIIAVGDIHGDYEHLIAILRHAKLIDEENNWIGKDSILVQVGDLNQRGNETPKIYNTMIDLREQAKEKGGIVYMLLGNHEILEIQGNHFYTSMSDYELYGGVEGLEEAFSPEGRIGQFVRQEMNVTMVVGDSLFVHASLTPEYLAITEGGTVDDLNAHAREILLDTPSVEGLYELYLQGVNHTVYNDPVFNPDDGPLGTRIFANGEETDEMCSKLEKTLELTNTKRMIVGHTVQTYGKIRTKCNNKLILIDIGISRCIGGGYYGYLEMLTDKKEIWARYLGGN